MIELKNGGDKRLSHPWTMLIMIFCLCGCSTSGVQRQAASELQTPAEIVRTLCGTDASPKPFNDPAQVLHIRGLLASDLYGKLMERAESIQRLKIKPPTDTNDRMMFGAAEFNPFVTQSALTAKATVNESISGNKASVAVADDLFGQDEVNGILHLNFYFQRFGSKWRLIDEIIIFEDTRPDWKSKEQEHLIESLDSDVDMFRKMESPNGFTQKVGKQAG